MNQSERVDDLLRNGWKLYRTFPKWQVFSRRNGELSHYYFAGFNVNFITVFRNGRTARGIIIPK